MSISVKGKNQVVYVGQRLRTARLEASIGTQKELAERTGIPPNIISDLERGKRQMSRTWAMRIGKVVKVYWADLMKAEEATIG